jgi:Transport protein Trs120 or TRAPPC9, TRAPP II complex subunit
MLLPLKKIQLPDEVTSQAIPMLSDRQFVVDKANLSKEGQKLQRELFWYREELFKSIRGHWREVGLHRLTISTVFGAETSLDRRTGLGQVNYHSGSNG